jgi:ATP/maltotriose-dependent transcriptional regulator MalT/DNA-binding SARP family transcriptional activator
MRHFSGRWKVGVLSAPAGYGKTTLAAQVTAGRNPVWCRLSPEDRDTAHLLGNLLAAGLRLRPPVGTRTSRLFVSRRDMERDGGLLTGSLLDELIHPGGERFVVLDDLHVLSDAREALGWIRRLIEESAPSVRFLLTCRGDCPLPLARLRVREGLVQVGAQDLEFTEPEQRRLLEAGSGHRLSRGESTRLRGIVGGWAAGLVLASQHVARTGHAPAAPDLERTEERNQRLVAYLAEEVYAPLPRRLQRDLCRAALLEDLDRESLRVLLGRREGDALLHEITQRDLFVRMLPDGGAAPRFHPLLRAYLRGRLEEHVEAGARQRLAARLSRYWLRRGERGRAVRALLSAGEIEDAVRLFEQAASETSGGQERSSLAPLATEILRQSPDRAITSPWVCYHATDTARQASDYIEATRLLHAAQDRFLERRAYVQAARSYRREAISAPQRGQLREGFARGVALLDVLPKKSPLARGLVTLRLGALSLEMGRPDDAERFTVEAIRLLRLAGDEVEIADASVQRASIAYTKGRWDIYVRLARQAMTVYRRAGYGYRLESLLINSAEAFTYLGEEEKALTHLDEAKAVHSSTGLPVYTVLEAIGRARARSEKGDLAHATEHFAEARTLTEQWGSSAMALQLDAWTGIHERRCGRLRPALRLLSRALLGFGRIESPPWIAFARMERALVIGLLGRTDEALAELDTAAASSKRMGDRKELARNMLFRARVLQRVNRAFIPAFEAALRALTREHYIVLLRKEADVSVPLLISAIEDGGSPILRRALSAAPEELRARVDRELRKARKSVDRSRADKDRRVGRGDRSGMAAGRSGLGADRPGAGASRPGVKNVQARPGSIEIRLLGDFTVEIDGRPVRFPRRASEALVAYLAMNRRNPVPREVITEAIWPGAPGATARNRFDVTLFAARRALEPEAGRRGPFHVLITDAGLCRLGPVEVGLDVESFESHARSCRALLERLARRPWTGRAEISRAETREGHVRIEAALELYRGDLLPGLPYADWVQAERERLRDTYHRILLGKGMLALHEDRATEAAEAARAILADDPLHEEGQRLLMPALAAQGEWDALARGYALFARRFVREMGTLPGPETAALYRDLTGGRSVPDSRPAGSRRP